MAMKAQDWSCMSIPNQVVKEIQISVAVKMALIKRIPNKCMRQLYLMLVKNEIKETSSGKKERVERSIEPMRWPQNNVEIIKQKLVNSMALKFKS